MLGYDAHETLNERLQHHRTLGATHFFHGLLDSLLLPLLFKPQRFELGSIREKAKINGQEMTANELLLEEGKKKKCPFGLGPHPT